MWVDASKKKPEKSGGYLVITDWHGVMVAPYSKKHDQWGNLDSLDRYDRPMNISFWMEIPEVPKCEKGKTTLTWMGDDKICGF